MNVLRRIQLWRRYAYDINNYSIYQQYAIKRFSTKLSAFKRPSKSLKASKKKTESYKRFMTKEPIVLGESTAKRMLYSVSFVTVGLFAYSIYALCMYWNINDLLLPAIITVNIGLLLLVRSIVFAQVSSVTLLPSYRLRFDRFGWFGRMKPRNGVEFDFHEIESISHGRYGYWFNTPFSKRRLSFPLHLWSVKTETLKEQEIMNALVKLFEKKKNEFRWTRLNEERKSVDKTYKDSRWQ
eukprot:121165_1